jgi:tRNA1(Val) A37 N6-methylase TrmN6
MAALCGENAVQNGLQNRIRVLTADIREMPPVLAGSLTT